MVTLVAEEITCFHQSEVVSTGAGDIETCRHCGQEILITEGEKPSVLKRGYIGGVMTLLHPEENHGKAAESTATSEPEEHGLEEQPASLVKPGARRRGLSRKEARLYFEKRKTAIITDYNSLKMVAFLRKWHMSTTTWGKLKKEWNVAPKPLNSVRAGDQTARANTASKPASQQSLPPFPPFSDRWFAEVQLAWLQAYKEISAARRSSNARE